MSAKLIHLLLILNCGLFLSTVSLAQTCENAETFDEFSLGSLPAPMNPGYFTAYGSPQVVEQNCPVGTPGRGVSIQASVDDSDGDAVGYTMTGGVTGGEQFISGQQYVFRGSKLLLNGDLANSYTNVQMHIRLTNDLSIGNACPTGDCELVTSKDISGLTLAACEDWGDMVFTPMANYDHFVISVTAESINGENELFVMIDNWCIEEVLSLCEASFTYEEGECGELCFTSTSTGATTYLYEFFGPASIPNQTTADFCLDFPIDGQYQVQLSISCADGSFDNSEVEFITINNDASTPVYFNCPPGPIFLTGIGADCEVEYMLPDLGLDDLENDIVSETCTLNNIPFTGNSVTLPAGQHVIRCTAVDACGNEGQCDFEITVECETSSDTTDCTNFDDQSAGGWYRYNMIAKSSGSGYNISNRPVGLPATGPSGLPSDIYMKADDLPGSTWLINEVDYDGDWKEYIGQCFCFDYNVISDGDSGGIPLDAAPYFLLTSAFDNTQPIMFGTNPVSAIRWTSTINKTERDGWNNYCIGVDSCDASGNLPTVKDGTWSYVTGASATCQDFNDILCNVETVMFGLDLTGSPTEEYGFDNMCTGPCPPEPVDCEYSITADTISQENGECCYELDFTANASWYYVDLDLTTPGVIFNTAMVDTNDYNMDTLSNGTKLRITGKTPGFGGNMPISTQDFLKFCFANVDSAAQTPQCVVASYFGPGPVDGAVLACRDTLKFNCPAPTTEPDSCTALSLDATCDPDDPHRYKLTFDVTNNTAFTARRINLTSQDPNVKFLPIGAPAGAVPQSIISVPIPGGLAAGGTATGLMATLVTTTAVTSPTQWCVEGHILTDGMCCTAPDYFCTELDVCCDPCDEKSIEVTDISGIAAGQTLSFGASDDGYFASVMVGFLADASGPVMQTSIYNSTVISDGVVNRSYLNFDLADALCDGAVVIGATLNLFASDAPPSHYWDNTDDSCFKIRRVTDPWTEATLSGGTAPNSTSTNEVAIDAPDFPFENYTVDVTAIMNDILSNPSMGHGFEILNICNNQNTGLNFATKDHPNPSLHPQLVLTLDDSECPEPSLTGDCCYAVDLINECPTEFFTHVELKSITPGVNIGSHATGGAAPQDWYVSNSTPNCVTWNHTSGYIPSGTTADLVQFCLDDIDPTEVPQDVVLHWYALDGNGEEYIACSDTMTFECEPPVDNDCIAVLDTELKGSPCDSLDCYETPWCVQWLRDTIAAQAGLPEFQSYNTVEKGLWNGQTVFIATNPTPPGAANIGNTDIYLCNGNLIQSCAITIAGEVCMPNASIDPFVDVTGKMLVWQTGDAIPPLDPDCANGTGGQNVIDVCLTFKNTSQHYADQFILYPITSGVSYWPNPVSLLPGGSNPCDTSTVTFQLYGSAITPGTTVKFAVRLADTQNPDDWCCFESDTVCVTIPECPPADECCASKDTFDMLVAQGFQDSLGGCTIKVCANQFDTCHWFNNASPLWGDGTPVLNVITPSDPPNNCWTHTYTTPGTYTITLAVGEGDDIENPCWTDTLTYQFECPLDVLPCDSLLVTNAPATEMDSTCCSVFTIENNDPSNTYKGLVIRTGPPVSISQIQGLAGYTINQLSPYRVEVLHPSGNIPTGVADVFTLCTTDYGTGPQSVTVHWLQQVGDDCIEVCPSELEMECSGDDEFKCFEFVQDSVHCESSTYCFQITNTSNPSFDIASVILYGLNGGTLSPTSITIPAGPLAAGATSDWMCVNYSGAAPGDSICYSIAAENAMTGTNPNICCTDTLVQCFTVPDCPPDPQPLCGECPNGQPLGTNLIVNGDFEAGNTGFTSGLTYVPSGSLISGQYGIRNSSNLGNVQWSATDHTTGTGDFLVVDGFNGVSFWSTTVTTIPGQLYSLCFFYDHLVDPSSPDAGSPSVEVVVDGSIVSAPVALQTPDGWQNETVSITATSTSTTLSLVMRNNASQFGDIAIDDISLASCGEILTDDCCDNIDEDEIADYYQNNIVVINGDCEGCFTVTPLDSCDILFVDFDQNGYVLIEDDTTCYAFTEAGTYPFTVKVERRDSDGELCFEDTFELQFEIEGCPPIDDCCDISQEDFDTKFATGINYNLTGCELCLPFALDSCEYLDVDYGDGTSISLQGGGVVPCYTYPGPSGSYTVTVDYYRLDANGDTCRQADAVLDIVTSCPPVGGPCLTVIDGELDCELEAYCFRITNTSTFTMKSLAFIELTAGIALSPDPYQLLTPLAPGATSEEICLSYIGGFQGDTICFDVVGHQEDITIGEPPAFCCQDTVPVCFVLDCPVSAGSCLAVVQDSIDCESNIYCIRVRNTTFFDMNSIAFHNYSAGHSLSPDPVGIPTLTPGSTSDWICLTFSGAVQGDEVCYNIIGHEQDLSMGQEPIFCCSDTTQYCFDVDCEVDDCCSISDDELEQLLFDGLNVEIVQCVLTLPFPEDSCAVLSIEFGDGNVWQSTGTDTIVHSYAADGVYILTVSIQYFDANGELCRAIEDTIEVTINDCGNEPPCMIANLEIFNALSPNNDGLNDELIIEGSATCERDIKIFNRWGQLVYSKKNYQNDWRGNSFSGELLAEGTYFLVVEIPDGNGNVIETTQTYVDIRK